MKPWNVIHALAQVSGKNDKAAILKKVPADSEFWRGCKLSLDPFVTFGIKKLPTPAAHSSSPVDAEEAFVKLADALAERKLTGKKAQETVGQFAAMCSEEQWEWWYSRLLEKDLDCGVSVDTINKHAPEGMTVFLFEVNLATDMKKVIDKHIPTDAFFEAKYDGVRTAWFVKNGVARPSDDPWADAPAVASGEARAFSRNGKEFFNFGNVGAQLALLVEIGGFPKGGVMIDGEVISKSFNDLMRLARRQSDLDEVKHAGTLMSFDILPLEDFLARRSPAPLFARRELLEDVIEELRKHLRKKGEQPMVDVSYAERGDATDQDLVQAFLARQLEAKFEGMMIKRADGPYVFDRDVNWLKLKPTDTWDLTVVGTFEGKPGTKYEGMLGGLICEGVDDGDKISVRVGGGIKDEERDELWRIRDQLPGRTVEVMADCKSKNQDGTFSLRFPRLVRFRDDK